MGGGVSETVEDGEEHSKRFFPMPPAIETRQAKQEVIEATIGIMSG